MPERKASLQSRADRINYKLAFIPPDAENQHRPLEERGFADDTPYHENLDWLRQWLEEPYPRYGYVYLVVCVNEDSPEEIWEMVHNVWNGRCYRVWKEEDDEQTQGEAEGAVGCSEGR